MAFKLDSIQKFSRSWSCKNSTNYKLYIPPLPPKGEFDYDKVYNELVEQFGQAYLNKKFE